MTSPFDFEPASAGQSLPLVIADFGGRRKIFERRIHQVPIHRPDRRSGKDQRSGFDRRGIQAHQTEKDLEKRAFLQPPGEK